LQRINVCLVVCYLFYWLTRNTHNAILLIFIFNFLFPSKLQLSFNIYTKKKSFILVYLIFPIQYDDGASNYLLNIHNLYLICILKLTCIIFRWKSLASTFCLSSYNNFNVTLIFSHRYIYIYLTFIFLFYFE